MYQIWKYFEKEQATIARNKLLGKTLLTPVLLPIQQMLVALLWDKISVYMLRIVHMLNGQPIM